jgi:GntR family transcriptional regulator
VSESVGRPAYQQVADDLRQRIASGELPVGSPIPSTAKLASTHGVSITVVRAAVAQLRTAGLVIGQPGKGVFVSATPDAVAGRAATIEELARQLDEIRADLRRAEAERRGETSAALAALRQDADLLRRNLMALYAELGRPYPADGLVASTGAQPSADRGPAT